MNQEDLGFSYLVLTKAREVALRHHGKLAATLRGAAAADFIAEIEQADEPARQQLMARLTGNYKRGNEGLAARHARNLK